MHFLFPLFAVLLDLLFKVSNATPLVIPWNTTHSYGPDGPWPVVTVQIGSSTALDNQPLSTVDLYPGGIWESMIIRRSFCNDDGTVFGDGSWPCLADEAGWYTVADSRTVIQGFTDEVGLIWQWSSNMAENLHGRAENVLDTMRIPTLSGTFVIPNSTISAVQAWQIGLPDGTSYPVQVGTLSLGGSGKGDQTFGANATGQTVPGYAYAQGVLASNSWGLHYGSASLNQEGSLVFGGYDQTRVLGDVGAFDLAAGSTMLPNLLDIQIGVENGTSPFSEGSYTGLLKLNSSFKGVQPAVINPIVPYLFMSRETCDAVAENLPLVLNPQIGLYLWKTEDPQYERILKSPAYLAFVFRKAGSGNLTIKVSFQLLNLTLEAPIVNKTQQYFPCRPFHALDNSGAYFLGKAFLQAAFVGMNWQQGKFFLAQAPGPGVGASNVKSISPNDLTISSNPIEDFAVTWAREWKSPSDNNNDRNTTTSSTTIAPEGKGNSDTDNSKTFTTISTSATNGQNSTSGSGMSSGTKAGIAIGAAVGALAVAGAVLLSCWRRGRLPVQRQEKVVHTGQDLCVYEKDGRIQYPEIGVALHHEAANDHEIYEVENDHEVYEAGNDRELHELHA